MQQSGIFSGCVLYSVLRPQDLSVSSQGAVFTVTASDGAAFFALTSVTTSAGYHARLIYVFIVPREKNAMVGWYIDD